MENQFNPTAAAKSIDLSLLVRTIIVSIPWIMIFFILAGITSFLYLRYTIPIYESNVVFQVNRENKTKQIFQNTKDMFYGLDNNKGLESDIEVFRSELLIKKALKKLPLEVGYFIEGKILTEERYIASSYRIYDYVIKDSNFYNSPIYLKVDKSDILLTYSYNNELYTLNPSDSIYSSPHFDCKLKIIDKEKFLGETDENKSFFRFNGIETLVSGYKPNVSVVVFNPLANTITVNFKHSNPVLARDFVSAMVETFIEFDRVKQTESSENVIAFINSQKDSVDARLLLSERLIKEFRKENNVIEKFKIESDIDYLKDLDEHRLDLVFKRQAIKQVSTLINAKEKSIDDIQQILPYLIVADFKENIYKQVADLYELLKTRQLALGKLTTKNENITNLNITINNQIGLIQNTMDAVSDKIDGELGIVNEKIAKLEKNVRLTDLELDYQKLLRIYELNSKYYNILLEKQTEYELTKVGVTIAHQVLESAYVPKTPISPNKNLIYSGSFLLAFLLSIPFVLIRYFLHNQILGVNDIVKNAKTNLNILGIVPTNKEKTAISQLVVDKRPKSIISEAFRNLRTNLQFISNVPGSKLLAVTSTISGEGKTFVAINIGGIVALTGKKVIIIDLDMRKPKIHLGFGGNNEVGMSTLLIGKNTIEECTQKSELNGLDYITAGPIPPNPSELIINGAFEKMLEKLKLEYDLVIVDTPPVGLVTDGIHIIKQADYPLYIVRSNYSKYPFVKNIERIITENGVNNLSVVLNGVTTGLRSRYGYGYDYGYGYGYGYGGYYEESGKKK